MKTLKIIQFIVIVQLLTVNLNNGQAQVPQATNYQGIARNAQGDPVANQNISLRLSITNGNSGPNLYQEVHQDTTNQFGLFTFKIGKGTVVSGNFSVINWGNVSPYLKVEMDITGGTNYSDMGSSEWVSVPYALHSKTTGAINGTQNYVAKFTPNGTTVGNSIIFDNGSNVGIGTNNPNDKLDVVGNGQISGYLKVGNPVPPTDAPSYTPIPLYSLSYLSGTEGWSQNYTCGTTCWFHQSSGPNAGMIYYENFGNGYNKGNLFSPWIWVPSGSSNLTVEGTFYCSLEDNWDGVFLEYMTTNGTWQKITNFNYGGYPDNAQGSNNTCSGTDAQLTWNGINDNWFFRVNPVTFSSGVYGNWVRFRFVGMEDLTNGTGSFNLLGFNVTAFGGTNIGGSFADGNIYAEKNVYAGSNVLIGDVAEYFMVEGNSKPGDLISLLPDKPEVFGISQRAYDNKLIGIHSTNPTVTLNKPEGVPVSLTGRVWVNVNTENGSIKIGDYLTSSSKFGHAMKADRPCFIVGRALENYDSKTPGQILCMVETGWYNPVTNLSKQSGGQFTLRDNSREETVKDPAVDENSRVFVTFRGSVGGYWISEIKDGVFKVAVEKTSGNPVPFDYFIDNAAISSYNKPVANSKTINTKNAVHTEVSEPISGTPMRMHDAEDDIPPPMPEDPTIGWYKIKGKGLVKSDM